MPRAHRRQTLSVVVPVFNEEDNLRPFLNAANAALAELDMDVEIVFVDDGSADRTFEVAAALAREDSRVRCLRFSRNFGSACAQLAGLRAATGDAAVVISVDLQDPPELVPEMVERWRQGAKTVWAVRERRQDPWVQTQLSFLFYRVFRKIGVDDYPAGGMDFGLFDRRILEHLREMRELNFFIPAIVMWYGYPSAQIGYARRERVRGLTKWSLAKRFNLALNAIVSFSFFPIRFISYLGVALSALSMCYAALVVVRRVSWGLGDVTGWPSLMIVILFIGGVQMVMLGMLGEYVWRSADQVRGRPQYIVMERAGFGNDRSDAEEREITLTAYEAR